MANPQVEDGHTRIANELLEKLMSTQLSGNQFMVLLCIIRKTYGFQKKQDFLTNNQIVKDTGLGKTVVSRCLKLLHAGNFITRNGHVTGLQKDWEEWNPELAKRLTVSQMANKNSDEKLAIRSTELAIWSTKVSHSLDTQKKKETIQKKGTISLKEKTLEIAETLRGKYPNLDFDHQMEKFMAYWFEGGRQLKNPKLAIMNWMDKASEFKKPVKSTWGVV